MNEAAIRAVRRNDVLRPYVTQDDFDRATMSCVVFFLFSPLPPPPPRRAE